MTGKNALVAAGSVLVIVLLGYFFFAGRASNELPVDLDPTPQTVTLSGTMECLPHLNTDGPQTEECAFGLKTDDGVHYAVNFGEGADAAVLFQGGAHITADGFVVIKEALSSDQWAKYDMKGIFTITKMIDPAPTPGGAAGKLDINTVCRSALAYMTFPDAASADAFVAACVDGKHPEVIERYKKDMGLGDGAAI